MKIHWKIWNLYDYQNRLEVWLLETLASLMKLCWQNKYGALFPGVFRLEEHFTLQKGYFNGVQTEIWDGKTIWIFGESWLPKEGDGRVISPQFSGEITLYYPKLCIRLHFVP